MIGKEVHTLKDFLFIKSKGKNYKGLSFADICILKYPAAKISITYNTFM